MSEGIQGRLRRRIECRWRSTRTKLSQSIIELNFKAGYTHSRNESNVSFDVESVEVVRSSSLLNDGRVATSAGQVLNGTSERAL